MWLKALQSFSLFMIVVGIIACLGVGLDQVVYHHWWGWLILGADAVLLYLGFVMGEWITRPRKDTYYYKDR